MKTKYFALTLFAITALTVSIYPWAKPLNNQLLTEDSFHPHQTIIQKPHKNSKIEVVFVLDTTGSMSGLIQSAKEKIWSIVTTMSSAQQSPDIKVGLVAFRDRGDQYVTKVIDLSSDLDSVFASLMDFQVGGGGDSPESVNQALHDAVSKIHWNQDPNSYKTIFLVGDAPPHMNYNEVKYPEILGLAKNKNIVINTIQCGQDINTTRSWQRIAKLAQGAYFQVDQSGGAVAMTSPFDHKIAELSRELDKTRLAYGNKEVKESYARKEAAVKKLHEKSTIASRARRATFNSSASGKKNLFGESDLIEDVTQGISDLRSIESDQLPQALQGMKPEERMVFIRYKAEKRKSLQAKIGQLTKQRSSYMKDQALNLDNKEKSLDYQLYDTIKTQAKNKGLVYELEAPAL